MRRGKMDEQQSTEQTRPTDKEKHRKKALKEAEQKIEELNGQIETLSRDLEDKTKELAESKDRYLRLAAEFDNYRKRQDKEIGQIVEYAGEDVLRNILPVLDDLERSIKTKTENMTVQTVQDGLELIYKKFLKILSDLGVQTIDSLNQPFNPDIHHAVMAREEKDAEPDMVIDEFEKGYNFKQRVLRYAKVVVSK
ncbi:MAG: nucleotide exchange factor GrpE [Candidatus Neomarinimicrobiota bacterium]